MENVKEKVVDFLKQKGFDFEESFDSKTNSYALEFKLDSEGTQWEELDIVQVITIFKDGELWSTVQVDYDTEQTRLQKVMDYLEKNSERFKYLSYFNNPEAKKIAVNSSCNYQTMGIDALHPGFFEAFFSMPVGGLMELLRVYVEM